MCNWVDFLEKHQQNTTSIEKKTNSSPVLSSIWRIFQMAWILATEIFVVSIKMYTFAFLVNFICWHYNFGQTIQQFFFKSQLVSSQTKRQSIVSPDLSRWIFTRLTARHAWSFAAFCHHALSAACPKAAKAASVS